MNKQRTHRPTRGRRLLTATAAAVALLLPATAARADPITFVAVLGPLIGGTAAAFVYTYGLQIALAAYSIYGGIDARRRAKAAQRDATRRYNAGVTDRSVTLLRGNPAWRIVYGECVTGGDVLAIFTSDKPIIGKGGAASVRPDGRKHLVIALASHQVESITDIFVDGVALGALDGDGYATGADWATPDTTQLATVTFSGSTTLPYAATAIVDASSPGTEGQTVGRTVAISGGGLTLTATDGLSDLVTVVYRTISLANSVIRVSKFLGTSAQTVDTYLNSVKPTEWDSSHRLRGIAGIVVTLDLEDPRFQGGPPQITARVKGKRLYDPRKDSTNGGAGSHRTNDATTWEWSDNPALCVRDWITGEYGQDAPHTDVDDATTIAAANACDVTITIDVGGVTSSSKTYTCNGVATTEEGRDKVTDDLADSMAGSAIYGAQWQIMAGAWSAPVMDLTDDDLHGQIEIIQAGAGIDELVNGMRGTYIGVDSASPTDFQPYQNSTFVTADGDEYWQDVALPYTNSKALCSNIARVLVERGRNSLIISYPAKLRAWPLQVGDRVRVTNAEYGYTNQPFRVTDWQFGLQSPVTLALQEDAAAAYDTVDAVVADPTPNTDLPSPWLVEAIALAAPESGTAHLVRLGDGTIAARVWVAWAALTGAYLQDGQGRVVVRWRRVAQDSDWQQLQVAASDQGVYLTGVADTDRLVIEAWAVNSIGHRGAADTKTHTVVGKTAAPANVSGLSVTALPGGVAIAVTPSTEADVQTGGALEIREGASWAGGTRIFRGPVDRIVWPWPAAGSYTIRAKWVDSSGNESASDAAVGITVGNASLINTPQLLANAATRVYSATASGVSVTGEKGVPTGTFTDLVSYTFTPDADCEVQITVEGSVNITTGASGSLVDYAMLSTRVLQGSTQLGPLRTYAIDQQIGFSKTAQATISRVQRFAATGGVAYTVKVQGQQYTTSTTCTVDDIAMRIEEIKR